MVSVTSAAAAGQPISTLPGGADSVSHSSRSRGVDYAALWRQVDAESARVVVIDLERRAIAAGRAMSESGDTNARMSPESPLERLFPGADAQVQIWAAELGNEPAEMVNHGLSPRLWTYFWRVDPKAAVLAVVHHRYGRGAVTAGDTATIRLLCEHWLAPELQAMGIGRAAQTNWNRVDRRARAAAPRELWSALAVLALATACGAWLALGGAAEPKPVVSTTPLAETQRLSRLADETLKRSLAHSLADRDYGEAQEALNDHLAMGQFASAVLLNDRQQVVAHAGMATPPVVGQPLAPLVSASLPAGARQLPLRWADGPIGELLTVPPQAAPPADAQAATAATATAATAATVKRLAGALLALAGLLSGAWLWRHLRARYR